MAKLRKTKCEAFDALSRLIDKMLDDNRGRSFSWILSVDQRQLVEKFILANWAKLSAAQPDFFFEREEKTMDLRQGIKGIEQRHTVTRLAIVAFSSDCMEDLPIFNALDSHDEWKLLPCST